MIKSELVQTIANRNPHLFLRDVENIVNAIFEEITVALAEGNRVELRGFGAFSVKNRPARVGRNPRTGESVEVEEKWIPFFKTGKELRERLNGTSEGARDRDGSLRRPADNAGPDIRGHAMNRILVFVVFLPLAIVLIALAVANRTSVPFTIDPFNPGNPGLTVELPLFVCLIAALAIGLIVGSVATWIKQGQNRRQARQREAEVRSLRNHPRQRPSPATGNALPKPNA